jgi:hypothetical protein
VAGPLTHIPMVGFWVGMLALATHANTGSWRMSLDLPYPEGMALWQALCAGAVIVSPELQTGIKAGCCRSPPSTPL